MKDCFSHIGKLSTSLIALVALVAGLNSMVLADGEDFSYRARVTFVVPIEEQWDFSFDQRLGYEDEARRLGHQYQDVRVIYKHANGWLTLSPALRVVHTRTDDRDHWTGEVRPHFNIAISSKLLGFGINNRSRFEYRDIEDKDNAWRFRHKLRLDSPMAFTPWKIKPYVSEEVFCYFNPEGLSAHRLQTGLFIPLTKKIRLDLFYFRQFNQEAPRTWSQTNVLGTYFRFKF